MGIIRDSEYEGPIGFINFGIPEKTNDGLDYPEEYLAGSIVEWVSLSNEVGLFKNLITPVATPGITTMLQSGLYPNNSSLQIYNLQSTRPRHEC